MSYTDYDLIATEYATTKQLPLHEHVELYSFLKLMPNLKDKKILDLGCGAGALTRKLAEKGASKVVGIDISEKMIALARKKEAMEPQWIKYVHHDVTTLGQVDEGNFDVVTAGFLLNVADSPEKLMAFCKTIYSNLINGGVFIALNFNFCIPVELFGTYRKYNVYLSTDVPLKEGMPITITFKNNDDGLFSVEDYYLSPKTYEDTFKKAGFSDFKWVAVEVSLEGLAHMNKGYWDHFIANPFSTLIWAKK